jgi:uncharacterized protein (TIGR02594 family)
MTPPLISAYTVALQFVGLRESTGAEHTAGIVAMLQLVDRAARADETPWCSAFVNYIAWLLQLPRSRSLAARSWLSIGSPVPLEKATPGWDVVVLSRGEHAPPAAVRTAPGHVGFYASHDAAAGLVKVLGGNQGDQVCLQAFPIERVLGVRRLV